MEELAARDSSVEDAIKALTSDDVRNACDVLAVTSAASHGVDGRVSIEVEPGLARQTDATIAQAKDLQKIMDRPNLHRQHVAGQDHAGLRRPRRGEG